MQYWPRMRGNCIELIKDDDQRRSRRDDTPHKAESLDLGVNKANIIVLLIN